MANIEAKIPTLTCSACRESQDVVPRAIHHVNSLENQSAREIIVKSGFSFVVTGFEPPPGWLLVELHMTGNAEKTPRWLCPLCSSMEAVVAKTVIDALKTMRASR